MIFVYVGDIGLSGQNLIQWQFLVLVLMINFEAMETVRGKKHPSEDKNGMKKLFYLKKKKLKSVSQQPQKPL